MQDPESLEEAMRLLDGSLVLRTEGQNSDATWLHTDETRL